jgi:hypothetical protein
MTQSRLLRGAKIWFARQNSVSTRTVQRWCTGETDPLNSEAGRLAIAWLEEQEHNYRSKLADAERQIERYRDLQRAIAEDEISRQAQYQKYE